MHTDRADYWTARWTVTQKDDPESRIWSVSYVNTLSGPRIKVNKHGLTETRGILETALNEIINFAQDDAFSGWISTFRHALDLLNSQYPERNRYYADCLMENSYSLEARRMLFAAAAAWVFGGMGSWNELYLTDKEMNEKYDQVSTNLYYAINQAFLAAVNSTEQY